MPEGQKGVHGRGGREVTFCAAFIPFGKYKGGGLTNGHFQPEPKERRQGEVPAK
jgi:hypothetical protein